MFSHELQYLCMEHEVFIKNLEIVSKLYKHEDSLNEILPQLLIIVRRLSAMNHGVEPKGDVTTIREA